MRTPQLPPYHDGLALQCSFFYLLDKKVSLIFWSPPVLSPDNARGPVKVEHVYQMLLFVLELLDLGLQFSVHTLQLLRLFLQALCLLLLLVPALGSCYLVSFPTPLFPFIFFRSYL